MKMNIIEQLFHSIKFDPRFLMHRSLDYTFITIYNDQMHEIIKLLLNEKANLYILIINMHSNLFIKDEDDAKLKQILESILHIKITNELF